VAAAFAIASAGAGQQGTRDVASGLLIPSTPGEVLPFSGGSIKSFNWSGYAVRSKKHKISGVIGTFVVPHAGNSGQLAATWAGIGGFKTSDLIQAGTSEDATSGPLFGPKYFAWYELLPHPETQLQGCKGDAHCKVAPGDHISIKIKAKGGTTWKISVTNHGKWSWSKTVHYNSSRSSAEWILEAPTIVLLGQSKLSHVGTVHFGPTSKFTTGSGNHTIAHGNPIKIVLSPKGGAGSATPSALAKNGQSFNDCAYKSSCPRPK
jgi:hypothetical protein